jgi:hypothetical protein
MRLFGAAHRVRAPTLHEAFRSTTVCRTRESAGTHPRRGSKSGQREELIGSFINKERFIMFLSALELRNIIESSFLPKRCQCTLSPDLSMTVKVFGDHQTDQVDLHVSGIDASHLNGCREINDLIAGLRSDLTKKTPTTHYSPRSRAV